MRVEHTALFVPVQGLHWEEEDKGISLKGNKTRSGFLHV